MIRSFNSPPDPAFDNYLARLEHDAELEATAEGFYYFVADPEQLGTTSGIVGKVLHKTDEIELELFLGADMPVAVRGLIAAICVDSVNSDDRYSVARASDEHILAADESLATSALYHIGRNLAAHRRGIALKDAPKTHPLTKATIISSLGWHAFRRPPAESGQEAIAQLERRGLFIPAFETDTRLSAYMRTKKGSLRVGLTSATEKNAENHMHICGNCTGQIMKGTDRITLSLDQPTDTHDHHHYHPCCFADKILSKLDFRTATIEPNQFALGQKNKQHK